MTIISEIGYKKTETIAPKDTNSITKTKTKNTTSIFNEQNKEGKETVQNSLIDEQLEKLYKEMKEIETKKKEQERIALKEKATPQNIENAKEKVFNMLDKWGNDSEYTAIDKLTDEDIILAFLDAETTKATENEFRKFSFFVNKQGLGKLHQRLIEISEKYGIEPYGGKDNYVKSPTLEIASLYGIPMTYDTRVEEFLAPHYRMYKENTNYAKLYNKMAINILQ